MWQQIVLLCALPELIHCSGVLAPEAENSGAPALPDPYLNAIRPYLTVFNRLPYPDIHIGDGRKRCDLDGGQLAVLGSMRLSVDGTEYLRYSNNPDHIHTTDLEKGFSYMKIMDMGSYRCFTFDDPLGQIEIPTAGQMNFRISTPSVESGLYNSSFDSRPLVYNLSSSVGPVTLSYSFGPQPDEKSDIFAVLDRLVRVFIFPPANSTDGTYKPQYGRPVIKAYEYMISPNEAAMPTTVVVVDKSIDRVRFYFPKKYAQYTPDLYRFTFGLANNDQRPDLIPIVPGTEYEVTGLTAGTPYVFLMQALVGGAPVNFTLEVMTKASSSDVIPVYKAEGDCTVYQKIPGTVLARMPIRYTKGGPSILNMKVTLADASTGEPLAEASYDYPGDHNIYCQTCHENGFTATITCSEALWNDTSKVGKVDTRELTIKHSLGRPSHVAPMSTAYFHPRVLRTSANGLVVRLPEKLEKKAREMEYTDVRIFNLHSRKLIHSEHLTTPGDTIVVVDDRGDWHVELEYVDRSGRSTITSDDNFTPPRYELLPSRKRNYGAPLTRVEADGTIYVNVAERLHEDAESYVAEATVLVRNPFRTAQYALGSGSLSGPGDVVIENITRWDSVDLQIFVTQEDGATHEFHTLIRRSSASSNSPRAQNTPSVAAISRTGFMFRMPPTLTKNGAPVKESHLRLLDLVSGEPIRQRALPGAGTFYIEDIETYPYVVEVEAVHESDVPSNSTFYFVPRFDGLNPFDPSGPIEVFIQAIPGVTQTQRVTIRVPLRITDLPETAELERIYVTITDGRTGPVVHETEIDSRGDFAVSNVLNSVRVSVKMRITTTDGSEVEMEVSSDPAEFEGSGLTETRRIITVDDLWRHDYISHYQVPEVKHDVGPSRIYPHPSGMLVHVPFSLAHGEANIHQAVIRVTAAPPGQEFSGTGTLLNTTTVAAFTETRMLIPSTLPVDVKITYFALSGKQIGSAIYHMASIPNLQASLSPIGPVKLFPYDDFKLILRVPPLFVEDGAENVAVTYSIINVDHGIAAVTDAVGRIGDTVIDFETDMEGRYELSADVTDAHGRVTSTVFRFLHDDVVISSHLPPLPESGMPFTGSFLRHVGNQCQVVVRAPKYTAGIGRTVLRVRVAIIDDSTDQIIASPTVKGGQDSRISIPITFCTSPKHQSVTVKLVVVDDSGGEHFVQYVVPRQTGGLPPLPATGHPKVLKSRKGRAFIQIPQRVSADSPVVKEVSATWSFFNNKTEVYTEHGLKPGYHEVDPMLIDQNSIYSFDFQASLDFASFASKDDPPKTTQYQIEVNAIRMLPQVHDVDAVPAKTVQLTRDGKDLVVFVPSQLKNGGIVGMVHAQVVNDASMIVEKDVVMSAGDNTVQGLNIDQGYLLRLTMEIEDPNAEEVPEYESQSFQEYFQPSKWHSLPDDSETLDEESVVPTLVKGTSDGEIKMVIPRYLQAGEYVVSASIKFINDKGVTLRKEPAQRGQHKVLLTSTLGFGSGVTIQTTIVTSQPPVASELDNRKFVVDVSRYPLLPMMKPLADVASPDVFRNADGKIVVSVPKFITENGDAVTSMSLLIKLTKSGDTIKRKVLRVGQTELSPQILRLDPFAAYSFEFTAYLEGDADVARDELSSQEKDVIANIHKFVFHMTGVTSFPIYAGEVMSNVGTPTIFRAVDGAQVPDKASELLIHMPLLVKDGASLTQLALLSFMDGNNALQASTTVFPGESTIDLATLGLDPHGTYTLVMEADTTPAFKPMPRKYTYTIHNIASLINIDRDIKQSIGSPKLLNPGRPKVVTLRVPKKPSLSSTEIETVRVVVLSVDGDVKGIQTGTWGDIEIDLGAMGVKVDQPLRFAISTQSGVIQSGKHTEPPSLEPETIQIPSGLATMPFGLLEDDFYPNAPLASFGFPSVTARRVPGSSVCDLNTCRLAVRVHPHLFPPSSPVLTCKMQIVNTILQDVKDEIELKVGELTEIVLSDYLSTLEHYGVRFIVTADIGSDKDVHSATVANGVRSLPTTDGKIPVLSDEPRVTRVIDPDSIAIQVPRAIGNSAVLSARVSLYRLRNTATTIDEYAIMQKGFSMDPGATNVFNMVTDWGYDWVLQGLKLGVQIVAELDGSEEARAYTFVVNHATMKADLPVVVDPTSEKSDIKLAIDPATSSLRVTCGGVHLRTTVEADVMVTDPSIGSTLYQNKTSCPGVSFHKLSAIGLTNTARPFTVDIHIPADSAKPFISTVSQDVRNKNKEITIVSDKTESLPRVELQPEQFAAVGSPHLFQSSANRLVVGIPQKLSALGHLIHQAELKVRDRNGNLLLEEHADPGYHTIQLNMPDSVVLDIAVSFSTDGSRNMTAAAANATDTAKPDPRKRHDVKVILPDCGVLQPFQRAVDGLEPLQLYSTGHSVLIRVPTSNGKTFVRQGVIVLEDMAGNQLSNYTLLPGDHEMTYANLGIDCNTEPKIIIATWIILDIPVYKSGNSVDFPFVVTTLPQHPPSGDGPMFGAPVVYVREGKVLTQCPDRVDQFGKAISSCEMKIFQFDSIVKSLSFAPGKSAIDMSSISPSSPIRFDILAVERGGSDVPDEVTVSMPDPQLLPKFDDSPMAQPLPTLGQCRVYRDSTSTSASPKLVFVVPERLVEGGTKILSAEVTFRDMKTDKIEKVSAISVGKTVFDFKTKNMHPGKYVMKIKVTLDSGDAPPIPSGPPGGVQFSSLLSLVAIEPPVPEIGMPIILPVSVGDEVIDVMVPAHLKEGPYTDMRLRLWHSVDDAERGLEPLSIWTLHEDEDKYISFSSTGVCFKTPCYLAAGGISLKGQVVILADAVIHPPTNANPDPIAPVVYSDAPDHLIVQNPFDGQSIRVEVTELRDLVQVGREIAQLYPSGSNMPHSVKHERWMKSTAKTVWKETDTVIIGQGGLMIGDLEPVSDYEVRCYIIQESHEEPEEEVVVRRIQTANHNVPVPYFPAPPPPGVIRTGGLVPKDMGSLSLDNFDIVTLEDNELTYTTVATSAGETFGVIGRKLGNAKNDTDQSKFVAELGAESAIAAGEMGEAVSLTCEQANVTVRGGYSSILIDLPKLFGGAPVCKIRVILRQPGSGRLIYSDQLYHPKLDNSGALVSYEASGLENNHMYALDVTYTSCIEDSVVCERNARGSIWTAGKVKDPGGTMNHAVIAKGSSKICIRTKSPFPSNVDVLRFGYETTKARDPIIALDQFKPNQRKLGAEMGTSQSCAYNLMDNTRYRLVVLEREEKSGANLTDFTDTWTEKCAWTTTNVNLEESAGSTKPHWFYVDVSSVYVRLPSIERIVNYTIARVDYESDGETVFGFTPVYNGLGYPNEYGPFYKIAALLQMTNYTYKVEAQFNDGTTELTTFSVVTDSMFMACRAGRPSNDMIPVFVPGKLATPYHMYEPGSRKFMVKIDESAPVKQGASRYPLTYDLEVGELGYKMERMFDSVVAFSFYEKRNMAIPRGRGREVAIRKTTPGFDYRLRVRVFNMWGSSDIVGLLDTFTAASEVPNAVPELTIENVGRRDMVVTWTPVLCPATVMDEAGILVLHNYCNGNETSEYLLEISPGPATGVDIYPSDFHPQNLGESPPFVEVFRGNELGATILDLLPAVNYTVRVSARNQQGFSAHTTRATRDSKPLFTLNSFPEHVTNIRNTTYEEEMVTIEWDKPRHNGLYIMFYNVWMRECNGTTCSGGFQLACSSVINTQCTVYNLTAGDSWQFRVTATNCKGATALVDDHHWVYRQEQLHITTHPDRPGQPYDLSLVSRSPYSMELEFTEGERNNGLPIEFYAIECDAGAYCLSDMSTVFPNSALTYTVGDPDRCTTANEEEYCQPACYHTWERSCSGSFVNGSKLWTNSINCPGNITLSGNQIDDSSTALPLNSRAAMFGPKSMGKLQRVVFCGNYPGAAKIITESEYEAMSVQDKLILINNPEITAEYNAITTKAHREPFLRKHVLQQACMRKGSNIAAVIGNLLPANTYRCRAVAWNKEGYSMYSRSEDPNTFANGLTEGLFDYFRTLDTNPLAPTGLSVRDPRYEYLQWDPSARGNSGFFVGQLMTPDDFPPVSVPEAIAETLGNPDRTKISFEWDHMGGRQGENGQPITGYTIARSRHSRDTSSSGRILSLSERTGMVNFAAEVPPYMQLDVETACTVSDAGDPLTCEFHDDYLQADTEYTYRLLATSFGGDSPTLSLHIRTTKGRPARPTCLAGDIYSTKFTVKCLTGDDWGAVITEADYQILNVMTSINQVVSPPMACKNSFGGVEVGNDCPFSFVVDLTPATTYRISSTAENEVGKSWTSEPIEVTTIAGRPDTPPEPENEARLLLPPPQSETGLELGEANSPTSRRFAIKYLTSTSQGADLTYCKVRIRGWWAHSTAFNTGEIACNPGTNPPRFDSNRLVDENGFVRPDADEYNRELLEMGCWLEERVYRHSPDDTSTVLNDMTDEEKTATFERWGVPSEMIRELISAAPATRDATLLKIGGIDVGSSVTEGLFQAPNDTNPYNGGTRNRWVNQNADRYFVLPYVHSSAISPVDGKFDFPTDTHGTKNGDNPHLLASTTYQVSVSCANLCQYEMLIEEENLARAEAGEPLIDASIGDRFCESDYSAPTTIETVADPPPAPAAPAIEYITTEALAARMELEGSLSDPILWWSLGVSCEKGWCPEFMCDSIDGSVAGYSDACSDVSNEDGVCYGNCIKPREFYIPHCYEKKCRTGASLDAFEAMCDRRAIDCSGSAEIDMTMYAGQCSADTRDNREWVKKICCDFDTRLSTAVEDCHDFGNPVVCDECMMGPPYSAVSMQMTSALLTDPSSVGSCPNNCDHKFNKPSTGCCKPNGELKIMPGTTYTFRTKTHNAGGDSPWSPGHTVTTCAEEPQPPRDLHVHLDDSTNTPGSKKSVKLYWKYPAFDGGAQVSKYVIMWKASVSGDAGKWQRKWIVCRGYKGSVKGTCDPGEANAMCMEKAKTSFTVADMIPGVVYKFKIRAANPFGSSDWVSFDASLPGMIDNSAELADEMIRMVKNPKYAGAFNADTENEPLGIVTPGDTPDTPALIPNVLVSKCGYSSCRLSWTEPALLKTETFMYAIEYRVYTTSQTCPMTSTPSTSCLSNARTGFIGDIDSPFAWYGDDSCHEGRTIKVDGISYPVTSCNQVTVTGLSLSPTNWSNDDEWKTIETNYQVFQYKLMVVPSFEGSCQLPGSSCVMRDGDYSNVDNSQLNSNVFTGCTCSNHGNPKGAIEKYKAPFETSFGSNEIATNEQVTEYCDCSCDRPYGGPICADVPITDDCRCNGGVTCWTFSPYAKQYSYACPGEHVFYRSALHGVVTCPKNNPNCAEKNRPREAVHNWMHKMHTVVGSNKVALRYYDDDMKEHTIGVEYGFDFFLKPHYTGPGPLTHMSDSRGGCSGSACNCWGDWDNKANYQKYRVPIAVHGSGPYFLEIEIAGSSAYLRNSFTATQVTVTKQSDCTTRYFDIALRTSVWRSQSHIQSDNQAMVMPTWTGMCGSQGATLPNGNPRPHVCRENYGSDEAPQFITDSRPDLSLFATYDRTGYCTYRLRTNKYSWKHDTYWGYPNYRYSMGGSDMQSEIAMDSDRQLATGSLLSLSEDREPLTAIRPQSLVLPKKYDVLRAERELRLKQLTPLVPRVIGTDTGTHQVTHSKQELFGMLNAENTLSLEAIAQVTDDFMHAKRVVREGHDLRDSLATTLVQEDYEFTEVVTTGTVAPNKHLWQAVTVANAIDEFLNINSQDQTDEFDQTLQRTDPIDPVTAVQATQKKVDNSDLADLMNVDIWGDNACAPTLFAMAQASCAGVENTLQTCVRDICNSGGENSFAVAASSAEQAISESADELASAALLSAEQFNAKLAEMMSGEFSAKGGECPTLPTGKELWNMAPYDRNVPAWTYERYVTIQTVHLSTLVSSNSTVTVEQ